MEVTDVVKMQICTLWTKTQVWKNDLTSWIDMEFKPSRILAEDRVDYAVGKLEKIYK